MTNTTRWQQIKDSLWHWIAVHLPKKLHEYVIIYIVDRADGPIQRKPLGEYTVRELLDEVRYP